MPGWAFTGNPLLSSETNVPYITKAWHLSVSVKQCYCIRIRHGRVSVYIIEYTILKSIANWVINFSPHMIIVTLCNRAMQ